jgi:hypothetical protein
MALEDGTAIAGVVRQGSRYQYFAANYIVDEKL